MKRFIKCLCAAAVLSAVLLTACANGNGTANSVNADTGGSDVTVTINGNAVGFDQPPVIVDGRTLVPLRAIFEALGATVDWNGDTQTVTSTRNNTTVLLTIGINTMAKNDKNITLDVPAQLINDRTLVPVRAIAESFDCTVDWNGDTQTVIISDNAAQSNHTAIELNNTYTTQFGAVNAITYPQFAFDYSDNWTVTTEEVSKGSQSGINEEFVLTNANGVTVHYIDFGNLGGSGKSIVQYEVTKAADSQFTAGYMETDTGVKNLADEWGNFMVGEVKAVGEYDMTTGELMPADGKVSYAVMPNSYIGTHEAAGLTGYYEEFATEYGNYLLFAEASDNGFSEQDKQEVIRILSSFRRISENL